MAISGRPSGWTGISITITILPDAALADKNRQTSLHTCFQTNMKLVSGDYVWTRHALKKNDDDHDHTGRRS